MKKPKDFLFLAEKIHEHSIVLSGEEYLHATKVLRLAAGDVFFSTNGRGSKFKSSIERIEKNELYATILNTENYEQVNKLSVAVALPKSPERLSLIIEKLVEFGTKEIIFLITERTEKISFNAERILRIAKAALKQSKNLFLPIFHSTPIEFKSIILNTKDFDELYIAHCQNTQKEKLNFVSNDQSVLFMIGPEGDFTEKEVLLAQTAGFKSISLGNNRLRTETASVHVASVYYNMLS